MTRLIHVWDVTHAFVWSDTLACVSHGLSMCVTSFIDTYGIIHSRGNESKSLRVCAHARVMERASVCQRDRKRERERERERARERERGCVCVRVCESVARQESDSTNSLFGCTTVELESVEGSSKLHYRVLKTLPTQGKLAEFRRCLSAGLFPIISPARLGWFAERDVYRNNFASLGYPGSEESTSIPGIDAVCCSVLQYVAVCYRVLRVYFYPRNRSTLCQLESTSISWKEADFDANSSPHGFQPHRPSIKGTKLLFAVIKANSCYKILE